MDCCHSCVKDIYPFRLSSCYNISYGCRKPEPNIRPFHHLLLHLILLKFLKPGSYIQKTTSFSHKPLNFEHFKDDTNRSRYIGTELYPLTPVTVTEALIIVNIEYGLHSVQEVKLTNKKFKSLRSFKCLVYKVKVYFVNFYKLYEIIEKKM